MTYNNDPDLVALLGKMEKRLQALETGNRARNTSISRGGINLLDGDGNAQVQIGAYTGTGYPGLQVNSGGQFTLADPDTGDPLITIGRLSRDEDSQFGMALWGPRLDPDDPATRAAVMYYFGQALVLADVTNQQLLASDSVNGGLAIPHLPYVTGTDSNTDRWPATTGTDWTSVWWGFIERINPYLAWNTYLYVPAGCTAEYRLKLSDTVIGSTSAVGGAEGQFVQWAARGLVVGLVDYLTSGFLSVEVRITAGAGPAKFSWLQLRGDQS